MAATLAAGLDGVDRGLDAGERGDATGPDLPPTLLHAVDALIADPVVAGALDAAGPGCPTTSPPASATSSSTGTRR